MEQKLLNYFSKLRVLRNEER